MERQTDHRGALNNYAQTARPRFVRLNYLAPFDFSTNVGKPSEKWLVGSGQALIVTWSNSESRARFPQGRYARCWRGTPEIILDVCWGVTGRGIIHLVESWVSADMMDTCIRCMCPLKSTKNAPTTQDTALSHWVKSYYHHRELCAREGWLNPCPPAGGNCIPAVAPCVRI